MRTTHVDNVVPLVSYPAVPLPSKAAVVIIGGGIMGASIAFHLAEGGVRNIVLIERDTLGSGSSAKPLGGVRATFSDPGNIALGLRSLEAFERFGEKFRTDIALRQVGYLFLCRSEAEVTAVEESSRVQNALGGHSQIVSPDRASELNPFLDPRALLAASFSPRDGFAQPSRVVRAYIEAAQQLGVTVCEHTEVLDITVSDGAVSAVHTNRGTIATESVVLAAGAWSSRLGALLSLHLPIEPVRRLIGFTQQQDRPLSTVPFTLDLSTTLYFHNYQNAMLLGISHPEQEPGFSREFTYEWLPAFDRAAEIIAPSLAHQPLVAGWAGLYENTPDHNALIGSASEVQGVIYATGFSGHGFLQGPAVGELVRDIYFERESFIDPAPFDASRFTGARAISEVHII